MKAEVGGSLSGSVGTSEATLWNRIVGPILRFPDRLRDRRFWQVQALVLLATLPHYVIETLGITEPFETIHGLTITLYILPLLYAALNFGWEGAAMTALWAALLTSPSTWIWHRSGFHWLSELGQLAITLPVGMLVAWRVDRETEQRLRAEKTSADLKLLNEVGEILANTLEVEQQLPQVVRRLLDGLSLDSVWLCLEPESRGAGTLMVVDASNPGAVPPGGAAQELHQRLMRTQGRVASEGRMVAVPLLGETGVLGSLGARAAANGMIGAGQADLLTTVARQVQAALENARLYRQRQESLQSYVRQVTQAQEEERLRIARELHDETAQELVHVARKLEQLRAGADPKAAEAIKELMTMTRGTIQAVRRFSRDLRPSVLDDLGLIAALEMVVEDTSHRLPAGARLQVDGKPRRLDEPVELALFRIAQEALRNVEKHASATSATVELDFAGDEVRLSVLDDGKGFALHKNMSDLIQSGKLGLVGMKERAELVGGTIELSSDRGGGTRVTVRVRAASP
jgi:signal transduction histidine kinase